MLSCEWGLRQTQQSHVRHLLSHSLLLYNILPSIGFFCSAWHTLTNKVVQQLWFKLSHFNVIHFKIFKSMGLCKVLSLVSLQISLKCICRVIKYNSSKVVDVHWHICKFLKFQLWFEYIVQNVVLYMVGLSREISLHFLSCRYNRKWWKSSVRFLSHGLLCRESVLWSPANQSGAGGWPIPDCSDNAERTQPALPYEQLH